MYGEDWNYARTRLEGTLVRLDNEPVWVNIIEGCDRCSIRSLNPDGTWGPDLIVDLDSLNLKPFELGYMNTKQNLSFYISRIPMRRDWKQGCRHENLIGTINGEPTRDWRINSVAFYKMLKNDYPTFKEVLEKSGLGSAAWNRHWSIQNKQLLHYRHGEVVGKIIKGEPILDEEFHYLKESLRETL